MTPLFVNEVMGTEVAFYPPVKRGDDVRVSMGDVLKAFGIEWPEIRSMAQRIQGLEPHDVELQGDDAITPVAWAEFALGNFQPDDERRVFSAELLRRMVARARYRYGIPA